MQLDFAASYLKLIQFLVVSHFYWTFANRAQRKEALTNRCVCVQVFLNFAGCRKEGRHIKRTWSVWRKERIAQKSNPFPFLSSGCQENCEIFCSFRDLREDRMSFFVASWWGVVCFVPFNVQTGCGEGKKAAMLSLK